jgi:hypothetical protein
MRHIAAYLLLVLGGNAKPTADDVKKVLSAAGIQGDDARIASLLKVGPLPGSLYHQPRFPLLFRSWTARTCRPC